jgi:hypothetical protein
VLLMLLLLVVMFGFGCVSFNYWELRKLGFGSFFFVRLMIKIRSLLSPIQSPFIVAMRQCELIHMNFQILSTVTLYSIWTLYPQFSSPQTLFLCTERLCHSLNSEEKMVMHLIHWRKIGLQAVCSRFSNLTKSCKILFLVWKLKKKREGSVLCCSATHFSFFDFCLLINNNNNTNNNK